MAGPDVSIVSSGHDVADARLHRIVAACRRSGLSVEVFGLGDPGGGPRGVPVVTAPRGHVTRRWGLAWRFARAARGRVLFALDPDSALTCLVVGRLRRRAVVADVHEDYLALLRDRAWSSGAVGILASAVARAATRASARADLTVVADEHVPPRRARSRLVVRNLPDASMLPDPSPKDATPRALYVGDVRASRGLWLMLDVLEQAPGWHLDVVGPVRASDEQAVQRRLAAGDLASRVSFHGRLPPEESWALAQGAWCGMVLLEDTPAFRSALPSKLFEYLACGLAVIVTDLPRQRQMVESLDVGRVVDVGSAGVVQAAEQLRRWVDNAAELEDHRLNAAAWAVESLKLAGYDALCDRLRMLASARR